MFEWSSFAAGLVGALLGGGVTLGVAVLNRAEVRGVRVLEYTHAVIAAFHDLAEARNSDEVPIAGAYMGDVGRAITNVNRAITSLSMAGIKRRDIGVLRWTTLMVVEVIDEDDNYERESIATGIGMDLAKWKAGLIKGKALEKASQELDRAQESRRRRAREERNARWRAEADAEYEGDGSSPEVADDPTAGQSPYRPKQPPKPGFTGV